MNELREKRFFCCPNCGTSITGDSCFQCGTLFTFLSSNQVVDYEHYIALIGETEMNYTVDDKSTKCTKEFYVWLDKGEKNEHQN